MKKIVSLLILVVAFTFTAQAQKKGGKQSVEKVLKRLTTALDLTDDQQQKIKPLLISQIEDRKLMMDQMKARKDSGTKPSKEERKKNRKEREAKQADFNTKISSILTKEQFEKYQEISKKKKGKGKKMKRKQ
jgi:hypothetical protein